MLRIRRVSWAIRTATIGRNSSRCRCGAPRRPLPGGLPSRSRWSGSGLTTCAPPIRTGGGSAGSGGSNASSAAGPSGRPRSPTPACSKATSGCSAQSCFSSSRCPRSPSSGGSSFPPPAAARRAPPLQDPRDVRVDAICDRILAELRTSPDSVKDIFIKPEETVAALRATCRNLTRRERDVRRFLSPQDDERLLREREALQKRVDGEADEVTKMRLASALAALDAQRDQRLELSRAAARFDAEHTRISYTLENLYTQVVRMRSADSSSVDVAGAGLRRSLDMLSHEATALADALERVNSGETERLRKVASGPASSPACSPPGAPGTREKA